MQIFEGIRIIEVCNFISGPWATTFFANQGADIVKIETPQFGDTFRLYSFFDPEIFPLFSILNNNKRSVTLNLRKPEAQEIFRRLVKISDAVVDNLVVGSMERWGLGYEQLKQIKTDLIYVSISGFGRTGIDRYVAKPAFDLIAQAASGVLDSMRVKDAPGLPIADYSAGHVAAIALASALYYRERTRNGQLIDLSMQDIMYAINLRAHAKEFLTRASKLNDVSRILPIYNQYPTKDGGKIAIVVLTEPQWYRFCDNVLNNPELKYDKRFDTPIKRFDYVEELDEIVTKYTQNKTQDEALRELESQRIPCGLVQTIDDVRDHPQLKARGTLNSNFDFSKYGVLKATIPNPIIRYGRTPGKLTTPAPELGVHNREILCDLLGYKESELAHFKKNNII
ncbi:MAG: CaiB/BaiF CoA transferase family protein [Candidatus Thorarchaeota archaeon]